VGSITLPPAAQPPTYSYPKVWEEGYDISLGSKSIDEYEALLHDKLVWPEIAAAHIDEVFSMAPYRELRASLNQVVDNYLTRFSTKRSPTAALRLQATNLALQQNLDLRGLSPYDIPMISFKDLLRDFKDRKSAVFASGGSLEMWDTTIAESHHVRFSGTGQIKARPAEQTYVFKSRRRKPFINRDRYLCRR
jgi:hypothetical protein